jgi:hypothetical protein
MDGADNGGTMDWDPNQLSTTSSVTSKAALAWGMLAWLAEERAARIEEAKRPELPRELVALAWARGFPPDVVVLAALGEAGLDPQRAAALLGLQPAKLRAAMRVLGIPFPRPTEVMALLYRRAADIAFEGKSAERVEELSSKKLGEWWQREQRVSRSRHVASLLTGLTAEGSIASPRSPRPSSGVTGIRRRLANAEAPSMTPSTSLTASPTPAFSRLSKSELRKAAKMILGSAGRSSPTSRPGKPRVPRSLQSRLPPNSA